MAREFNSDNIEINGYEEAWPKSRENQKESALVESAKRKSILLARDRRLIYTEARIILGDLSKTEKPLVPVSVDPANAVLLRYDGETGDYLARTAVNELKITDPGLYLAVLRQVREDLKTYGTRRDFVVATTNEIKRIIQKTSLQKAQL